MTHDGEPFGGLRLLRRDLGADAVDEDLAPAAGDRVQAGVAQAGDRLPEGQLAAARDVLDLRRRQRVQVDLVARLDGAEEILVVVDSEIRMVSALHEETRAAERERLLDLLEDDGLRQQVALARVARPAVERAELAVRVADVGVVEVPVYDDRNAIGVGLPVPALVRRAPNRHEVARLQQRQRLVVGDALPLERFLENLRDTHGTPPASVTGTGGVERATTACAAKNRGRHTPVTLS